MRKSIISTAALGSLASVVLLCAAGPASAKTIEQCRNKFTACSQRCMGTYGGTNYPVRPDGGSAVADCIRRTCDKQYGNCVASTGTGGSSSQTSADPVKPKGGPRGPLGGGVKDEPKSPAKTTGQRAPLGGVLGQSSASGAGGTVAKSANGRR